MSYTPNELLHRFRSSDGRVEREGYNTVDFAPVDSDVVALYGSEVSVTNCVIDLINLLLSSAGCRRGQREGPVSSESTTGKQVQLITGGYVYQ